MRYIYLFLFLSGTTFAQVPTQPALRQNPAPGPALRRDSLPTRKQMPTLRPRNDFYRRPDDNPNVVRATLDNMPVLMNDTTSVFMPTRGRQQRRKKE